MRALPKTFEALTGMIRTHLVFNPKSSSDNRILRWAEKCADDSLSLNFSNLSDSDLRANFHTNNDLSDPQVLPIYLSLAATAIHRRLGAWRIFDANTTPKRLAKFHDIIDDFKDTFHVTDPIRYKIRPDFTDTPDSPNILESFLNGYDLNPEERTVVNGMAYAQVKRETTLPGDIFLSTEFYTALTVLDNSEHLRFTPTREQIITAALLTQGVIVELDAGEGKTISAAMAAMFFAAVGLGAHILTTNDYLVDRDSEWLGPVYESLGVSIGRVTAAMDEDERRSSYAQEIVYATVRELGFDYLRDNLKIPPDGPVQNGMKVAIVDEADHVLIDQHRTPLIISGEEIEGMTSLEKTFKIVERILDLQYKEITVTEQKLTSRNGSNITAQLAMLYAADPENQILKHVAARRGHSRENLLTDLSEIEDTTNTSEFEDRYYYRVDARTKTVRFTERGEAYVDGNLGILDSQRRWAAQAQAQQFLRAYTLFTRNIDYIVDDNQLILIDPFNGRLLPDNRYLHGLQNALELKENLPPTPEADNLAQITITGLMSQYPTLSGLTGTAIEAQDDFQRNYGLPTIRIEPAYPTRRTEISPIVANDRNGQHAAILSTVTQCHSIGRPVLIGTSSVEESVEISSLLNRASISHKLLNAVNSEHEAQIVRDAGKFRSVTVATNMAGRGTDIVLEPGLDERILHKIASTIADEPTAVFIIDCPSAKEASILYSKLTESDDMEITCTNEKIIKVINRSSIPIGETRIEFGLGLSVIGVSLNTTSRTDRQLSGRSGRQGAFGTSRLILSSLDDPIAFSRHSDSLRQLPRSDTKRIQKLIKSIQSDSEIDTRSRMVLSQDYNSVLEAQTLAFYRWRHDLIIAHDWYKRCSETLTAWAMEFTARIFAELDNLGYEMVFDRIQTNLWSKFEIDGGWMHGLGESALTIQIDRALLESLVTNRESIGCELFDLITKNVMLNTANQLWPQHLGHLHDLSLSCVIAGPTHHVATGEFTYQAHKAYLNFLDDVWRSAVPQMLMSDIIPSDFSQSRQESKVNTEILTALV